LGPPSDCAPTAQIAEHGRRELFDSAGFFPIDLGDLVTGGRMQQIGGPLPTLDLVRLRRPGVDVEGTLVCANPSTSGPCGPESGTLVPAGGSLACPVGWRSQHLALCGTQEATRAS
jgi:hypothetical protein